MFITVTVTNNPVVIMKYCKNVMKQWWRNLFSLFIIIFWKINLIASSSSFSPGKDANTSHICNGRQMNTFNSNPAAKQNLKVVIKYLIFYFQEILSSQRVYISTEELALVRHYCLTFFTIVYQAVKRSVYTSTRLCCICIRRSIVGIYVVKMMYILYLQLSILLIKSWRF